MRARNIKPGFYKNADLAECSVEARLLAPGLWMLADREGRLVDRPKQIKGEIFPYDNMEVEKLLQELQEKNHITRYQIGGVKYIQITRFLDHQKPHIREKQSLIPEVGAKHDLGSAEPALNDECGMMNEDMSPIKKRRAKISLQDWEKRNGDLDPSKSSLAKKYSSIELCSMKETYRSKCMAMDYKYVDHVRAFESWKWPAPQNPDVPDWIKAQR